MVDVIARDTRCAGRSRRPEASGVKRRFRGLDLVLDPVVAVGDQHALDRGDVGAQPVADILRNVRLGGHPASDLVNREGAVQRETLELLWRQFQG